MSTYIKKRGTKCINGYKQAKNNRTLCVKKDELKDTTTNHMDSTRIAKFKRACNDFKMKTKRQLDLIPQSSSGKTDVYLLNDVVVKRSGEKDVLQRYDEAQIMRNKIKELKLTNITVPHNHRCGEYLIEERLPILTSLSDNYDVYYKKHDQLDNIVRDMMELFKWYSIYDLISFPLKYPNMIRYDNIPFYYDDESKSYKIGLIDIEHSKSVMMTDEVIDRKDIPSYQGRSSNNDLDKLQTLINLFPYHIDMILEEFKAIISPEVVLYLTELSEMCIFTVQRLCKGSSYDLWCNNNALKTPRQFKNLLNRPDFTREIYELAEVGRITFIKDYLGLLNRFISRNEVFENEIYAIIGFIKLILIHEYTTLYDGDIITNSELRKLHFLPNILDSPYVIYRMSSLNNSMIDSTYPRNEYMFYNKPSTFNGTTVQWKHYITKLVLDIYEIILSKLVEKGVFYEFILYPGYTQNANKYINENPRELRLNKFIIMF